jgi:hypothetical protein
MKDYITFNIGCHLACAIVNFDYSGLTDYERKQLDRFLDNLKKEYHSSDLQLIDFRDNPQFMRCEVTDLMSNCVEFNLEVTK